MKRIAMIVLANLALWPAPLLAMAKTPSASTPIHIEKVPVSEYNDLHDNVYVPAQVARDAYRRAGHTDAEADYNTLVSAIAQAQADQAAGNRPAFDSDVATAKAASARVLAKVNPGG